MLVLTRRRNERIMIGDDVVLTVVYIGTGKVRITVEAPRELKIHRRPADPPKTTPEDSAAR